MTMMKLQLWGGKNARVLTTALNFPISRQIVVVAAAVVVIIITITILSQFLQYLLYNNNFIRN